MRWHLMLGVAVLQLSIPGLVCCIVQSCGTWWILCTYISSCIEQSLHTLLVVKFCGPLFHACSLINQWNLLFQWCSSQLVPTLTFKVEIVLQSTTSSNAKSHTGLETQTGFAWCRGYSTAALWLAVQVVQFACFFLSAGHTHNHHHKIHHYS